MSSKESREEKLQAAKSKAEVLHAASIDQLNRAEQFRTEKGETASLPELEARLSVVEKAYRNFEDAQLDLELFKDQELEESARSNFEEKYLIVKPTLQVLIKNLQTKPIGTPNHTDSGKCLVKLPKCEITPFAGDRKKWFTFYESFHKLIHSNPGLSDIARFGYLKSLLLNPAIKTIESLELTSENYAEALKLLQNRYQNKKLICEDHIREIFSLKPIAKSSSENIRHLLDTVNSNLRVLFSLQRPTLHWDDLIVHLLCSKLDPETRAKWDDVAPAERMPSLDELTNFLNKRCHALKRQATHSNKLNSVNMHTHTQVPALNRSTNFHRVTIAIQANASCNYSKGYGHLIYKCRKFIKLPIAERKAAVNHHALCINCLRADHELSLCTSKFICFQCKQQHHTLLHDPADIKSNPDNQSSSVHVLQHQHTFESQQSKKQQSQYACQLKMLH